MDRFDIIINKNMEITGLLKKHFFKIFTSKEFITSYKIITFEEIPSSI